MSDDPSAEEDLRATIDVIAESAEKLAAVEEEKRSLDPADPRLAALSEEAVELASQAQRGAVVERRIVGDVRRRRPRRPN